MGSNEELTKSNNIFSEMSDGELEQITGGGSRYGKKAKFRKPCPHCKQTSEQSVLTNDGWWQCPVCHKRIGAYKGLSVDKSKHPRG